MGSRTVGRAHVRPMRAEDLDSADRVLRLAFGTVRGLPDPGAAFRDADLLRTRFRAAPEAAWVAEIDGEVVGSVLATRWGSFGFFGPLSVDPRRWGEGVGSLLLRPVLDALESSEIRQAGLFTTPSTRNLGLYRKHGFRQGSPTVVMAKAPEREAKAPEREAKAPEREANGTPALGARLDEVRALTDAVLPGLDVRRELVASAEQGLGENVLLHGAGASDLEGVAVCHCGAGSEAGSDTCFVKFAAVRPGDGAGDRFERLLDACEAFASRSGSSRIVAGVDTGRLDAYRRLLARGFRTEQVGVSMWLRPEERRLDTPADYVLADFR